MRASAAGRAGRRIAHGLVFAAVLAVALGAAACGRARELVVYSGRNPNLIKDVVALFEKSTGIRVTVHAGGASELANRILEEKGRPQADAFIANDAGTLEKLRLEGALAPYLSRSVQAVPADLRAPDGSWVGASVRVRVIMYNTTLVKENELPKSVLDLADPKWKGQIALAKSSNESLIGHVTAMRQLLGDERTEQFLRGLIANRPGTFSGHTGVRQAVGKGEFKLGLVNHYYYHLEKAAGSPVGVVYPDQGEGQMGAVVNVAGVAVVRGARHAKAAKAFVDFLLSPEAQEVFAKANYEIPVLPGVPVHEARPLSEFKRAPVPLEVLGRELDNTVKLLEKVGMP